MSALPRETQEEIAQAYETSTLRQLAIRYQKSTETIRTVLKKNGVILRKPGQGPVYSGRPPLSDQLPSQYTEQDVIDAILQDTEIVTIAKFLKVKKRLIERIALRNGLVCTRGKWGRA